MDAWTSLQATRPISPGHLESRGKITLCSPVRSSAKRTCPKSTSSVPSSKTKYAMASILAVPSTDGCFTFSTRCERCNCRKS